jgi:uncharacterized cupredoxin-like copper-binding protein
MLTVITSAFGNTLRLALPLIALFAMPVAAEEPKGKTTRLPDLTVGTGDAGFGFKQDAAVIEAGKPYRMWLKATGKKECAFQAEAFFNTVKWRKIEVNKVEIKAVSITEIEFEQEGAAELFFTPTKAGEYTWACKGFAEKGLTGKFIVK